MPSPQANEVDTEATFTSTLMITEAAAVTTDNTQEYASEAENRTAEESSAQTTGNGAGPATEGTAFSFFPSKEGAGEEGAATMMDVGDEKQLEGFELEPMPGDTLNACCSSGTGASEEGEEDSPRAAVEGVDF